MKATRAAINAARAHVQQLLDAGTIKRDGEQVTGVASDGTVVDLGCLWLDCDWVVLSRYLTTHPTPDTW